MTDLTKDIIVASFTALTLSSVTLSAWVMFCLLVRSQIPMLEVSALIIIGAVLLLVAPLLRRALDRTPHTGSKT